MKKLQSTVSGMIVPQEAVLISELLGVLQHPIRLRMVCELLEREMFAGDLTECFGTTKGNISQHLTLLLRHEIISRERQGKNNVYRIADPRVETLLRVLKSNFCPNGPSKPSSTQTKRSKE